MSLWEFILDTVALTELLVLVLYLALRWVYVRWVNKPLVKKLALDIVDAIRDPESDATHQKALWIFYEALLRLKGRAPSENEWNTAEKIFDEARLIDDTKKS